MIPLLQQTNNLIAEADSPVVTQQGKEVSIAPGGGSDMGRRSFMKMLAAAFVGGAVAGQLAKTTVSQVISSEDEFYSGLAEEIYAKAKSDPGYVFSTGDRPGEAVQQATKEVLSNQGWEEPEPLHPDDDPEDFPDRDKGSSVTSLDDQEVNLGDIIVVDWNDTGDIQTVIHSAQDLEQYMKERWDFLYELCKDMTPEQIAQGID